MNGQITPVLERDFDRTSWILKRTARRGDGIVLSREAIDEGCSRLVVMGGDGTLNEVVNGYMLARGFEQGVALAALPCGISTSLAPMVFSRLPCSRHWHGLLQDSGTS